MPFVETSDINADDEAYLRRRCYVIVAISGGLFFASPAAGGAIDGVSGMGQRNSLYVPGSNASEGIAACRGRPVRVEASASFSAGASLVTGSDGRVATGAGTAVLRALEASAGVGSVIWAVFV